MGILDFLRKYAVQRQIRREQKLRERCIQYACDSNCNVAASIYRFIVKGTYLYYDNQSKKYEEGVYTNLEGVIHQDKNPRK